MAEQNTALHWNSVLDVDFFSVPGFLFLQQYDVIRADYCVPSSHNVTSNNDRAERGTQRNTESLYDIRRQKYV